MADQVSVINPFYCSPHSITLQINTETGITYNENGDRLFHMENAFCTLHNRRVLFDDKQKPIVTLYRKAVTIHERCKVFNGESTDSSKLLFSVRKTNKSIPPGIAKLNVFLANNQDKKESDFRVIIYGSTNSCTVYAGESPTIVANVENNGGFKVSVCPNVDYAFIVALLMIVKDMKCSNGSTDSTQDTSTAMKLIKASLILGNQ
ncbi:protein LURP-one-related 15-like isoform X1 [Vigna angularis]|uniref:protein LURP-one-related 15-like isoform X1 n=2 Tax=Phaseolus angularis TaxID=3914 RepID=UPI0022B55D18|nr:protein LURP-one-related 15-like isoform X1 [Vigna angularis]XP_052729939.1 protein LURP-one-related 15-like isoform X1 [Vigna angularis]XP_052729953.1 protein LURP-one-related 15-like isoform X1 [Vigna angularis]